MLWHIWSFSSWSCIPIIHPIFFMAIKVHCFLKYFPVGQLTIHHLKTYWHYLGAFTRKGKIILKNVFQDFSFDSGLGFVCLTEICNMKWLYFYSYSQRKCSMGSEFIRSFRKFYRLTKFYKKESQTKDLLTEL